jgi:DUF4097 and DUF4098 domain-containing protein YvlB
MSIRLILASLLLAAGWQQGEPAGQKGIDSKKPYVEKSEQEFAFYPGGKLEISAAAPGSFKVSGWQKASVRVEMEKIFFYVTAEQAQEFAKRFPIHVTHTPTSARISTAGSQQPGAVMEVNVQVYVPRERTDLNIKMVKGDLAVTSLNGSMEATIGEGNVEVKDISGYFSATTKRGDLKADLSGKRWIGYGITAATRRGSIDLSLPVDYSAALQLQTKDGKITFDYPAQTVQGESVPLKVVQKKKSSTISAPIGSDGAQIKLTTVSGDIVFKGSSR